VSRTEARIFTSIWADADFTALSPPAQRMYLFLISQPDLSFCGVVPLRTTLWAQAADGLTPVTVCEHLVTLETARPPFILMDKTTQEVLVRSFIRRDAILRQPKLIKPLVRALRLVQSPKLLDQLALEFERALQEERVNDNIRRIVVRLTEVLKPQVNTLSHRVSDRVWDTLWEKGGSSNLPSPPVDDAAPTDAASNDSNGKILSNDNTRQQGTRLPEDWQPGPGLLAWAASKHPHVSINLETEKFCNYWIAKSGANATKKNWDRTWQNWVITADQQQGRAGRPQQPLHAEGFLSPGS
jgi:hypothetical protein